MTAENTQGQHLLPESAFVDLVDASGEVVGSVPKHWTADDLPAGTKKKAGRGSSSSAKASDDAKSDDAKGSDDKS